MRKYEGEHGQEDRALPVFKYCGGSAIGAFAYVYCKNTIGA